MKAKPGKGDEFVRRFRNDVASTAVDIDAKSGRNSAYSDRLAAVQKGKERVRGYHLVVEVEGKKKRRDE